MSYKSMSNAMKRSMLLKRSVQKPLSTKRLHVLVDALGENLLYDTLNTWHLSNNGYLTVAQTVENLRWALPDMPMETLQSVAVCNPMSSYIDICLVVNVTVEYALAFSQGPLADIGFLM